VSKPLFVGFMGTGRCGSSAVAGAAHASGLWLGDDLIGPAGTNKYGHFETMDFHRITRGMLGASSLMIRSDWQDDYKQAIEDHIQKVRQGSVRAVGGSRGAKPTLWGLKETAFCAIWNDVAPWFGENRRLVVIHRKFESVVRSRMSCQSMDATQAAGFHTWCLYHMYKTLMGSREPVLHVQYEEMLREPRRVVGSMLDFIYDGVEFDANYDEAINFIDADARNF